MLNQNRNGINFVHVMIGIIFMVTLVLVGVNVVNAPLSGGNISYGINGMTESRCIEGYKFIVGQDGNARQILDEFGKGVRCENPNAGKMGSFGKM